MVLKLEFSNAMLHNIHFVHGFNEELGCLYN